MLPITDCKNIKEVEILAKTLAKSLMEHGFSQKDLLATATILIDQAIKMENKPIINSKSA